MYIDIHMVPMCTQCGSSFKGVSVLLTIEAKSIIDTQSLIMKSAIQASISFIEASIAANTPTDLMDGVISNRIDNIKTMLAKSAPDMEDMTSAMQLLGSTSAFSDDQKVIILKAMHTKVQDGRGSLDDTDDNNTKAQSHFYVENYLTDDLNAILDNKEASLEHRVGAFIDFLHTTNGCKFPDVASRKRIVSLILLSNGARVTPHGAKATYDLLTKINKKKREFRKHVQVTCKNFPQDPQDFMRLHSNLRSLDARLIPSAQREGIAHCCPPEDRLRNMG